MLSVTLRLLSMVALGAAQTSTLSVWVPPLDPGLKIPPDPKELVVSMVGSVSEPMARLNNAQLTHVYVGRQFSNICTRLRFENE